MTIVYHRKGSAVSTKPYPHNSPLFLVRVWVAAGEDGDGEGDRDRKAAGLGAYRGKVLHVVSGEAHYFESWADLIALMKLRTPDGNGKEVQEHVSERIPSSKQDVLRVSVSISVPVGAGATDISF